MIADIHTIDDDNEYYAAVYADIFKAWRDAKKSGKRIKSAVIKHVYRRRCDLWQAYKDETDQNMQDYIDGLMIRYEYYSYIALKKLTGDGRNEDEIGEEFNNMKKLSFENMRHERRN